MDDALLTLLKQVDTPTVCNAIEVVQGHRGFANFTRGTMVASHPDAPAMVGYARTATIAGNAPSAEPADIVRTRRMAYYKYMAEAPRPSVTVVQDADYPNCTGAYWGEINTTVHKGFGIAGALTNGLVRDIADLPDGFPVVAGGMGPSHHFVHVRDFDRPVSIMGMSVSPGDLVHADRHGAAVIPVDVIDGLLDGIETLMRNEQIVLKAANAPGFDFEKFEEAWTAFEQART